MPNLINKLKSAFAKLNCTKNQAVTQTPPEPTPLHQAVTQTVDYDEEYQKNINEQLINSVRNLNINGVKNALDKGAMIDSKKLPLRDTFLNFDRSNPIVKNRPHIIKLLINAYKKQPNADVNQYINAQCHLGSSLLHEACCERDIETIKLLIDNNADIDLEDNRRRSPLSFVRSLEIANLLIKNGAETVGVYDGVRIDDGNRDIVNFVSRANDIRKAKFDELKGLPNDLLSLNDTQKELIIKLTAPRGLGNPLYERQIFADNQGNYRNLIDYMQQEKPELLMFAEGYHKDKLFGDANKVKYTDIQKLTNIFTALRMTPETLKDPVLICNGNFLTQNPITQAGFELKVNHEKHVATKIQALGRGVNTRSNFKKVTELPSQPRSRSNSLSSVGSRKSKMARLSI